VREDAGGGRGTRARAEALCTLWGCGIKHRAHGRQERGSRAAEGRPRTAWTKERQVRGDGEGKTPVAGTGGIAARDKLRDAAVEANGGGGSNAAGQQPLNKKADRSGGKAWLWGAATPPKKAAERASRSCNGVSCKSPARQAKCGSKKAGSAGSYSAAGAGVGSGSSVVGTCALSGKKRNALQHAQNRNVLGSTATK